MKAQQLPSDEQPIPYEDEIRSVLRRYFQRMNGADLFRDGVVTVVTVTFSIDKLRIEMRPNIVVSAGERG